MATIHNKQKIECDVKAWAGRVPRGTIVLSRERTERSRTIPSFRKNERLEWVLKNIGTISKRTERELLEKNG